MAIRIAAIRAPFNTIPSVGTIRNKAEDEETLLVEISSIIFFINGHYLSLPKAKSARIYKNEFKPDNLTKFCHLQECENNDRDKNIIFESSQMKLKKVTSTLYDFGNTINILLDGFLNSSIIMVDFFQIAYTFLF